MLFFLFCSFQGQQYIHYQKELNVSLSYRDQKIERAFRFDFLVENKVILELKSNEGLLPIHEAQLLTYLKLAGKQVGLLINFNVPLLKTGIRRCILTDNKATNAEFEARRRDAELLGTNRPSLNEVQSQSAGGKISETKGKC